VCSLCILHHWLLFETVLQLAYLPSKKRDLISDNDDDPGLTGKDANLSADGKGVRSSADDILKDEKKNKKRGMLSWFKMRVPTIECSEIIPFIYFPCFIWTLEIHYIELNKSNMLMFMISIFFIDKCNIICFSFLCFFFVIL
jgi:hypothetical protein